MFRDTFIKLWCFSTKLPSLSADIVSNRMCAPVMVELEGETDPLQIAMKELK